MFIKVDELTLTRNSEPLRFDWSDTPEDKSEDARIRRMIELLDKAGLPKTASVDKTQAYINDVLETSMGRNTITKLVRIRKSSLLSEPVWSKDVDKSQHKLTEEDLLQAEHNAFHAKHRSTQKMEREWFGSFQDQNDTEWNDSESDRYPNGW